MSTQPIDQVIQIVGGQEKLAAILGIKSPSISGWRLRHRVPSERCIAIERAVSGAITRYDLRPDVFGEAPKRAPKRKAA